MKPVTFVLHSKLTVYLKNAASAFYSLVFLGILITFFISCSGEEEKIALTLDFEIEVTGAAPRAEVKLINKSIGADSYQWMFDEGTVNKTSSEIDPVLMVDKAGDFIITLSVTTGGEVKEVKKKVTIGGNSAVKAFSNILFSSTDPSFGRFFSTETGKLYKESEVDKLNGRNIDIAFSGIDGFESPDSEENIPGATVTKVRNHVTTELTVAEFHSMTTDVKLKSLTVEDDNEPFVLSVPQLILFENSSGKKGVILVKELYSEGILADIKVQKY